MLSRPESISVQWCVEVRRGEEGYEVGDLGGGVGEVGGVDEMDSNLWQNSLTLPFDVVLGISDWVCSGNCSMGDMWASAPDECAGKVDGSSICNVEALSLGE